MPKVGYILTTTEGQIISTFGGDPENPPPFPNPLFLPNGDQVCGAKLGEEYSGFILSEWFDGPEFVQ